MDLLVPNGDQDWDAGNFYLSSVPTFNFLVPLYLFAIPLKPPNCNLPVACSRTLPLGCKPLPHSPVPHAGAVCDVTGTETAWRNTVQYVTAVLVRLLCSIR